MYVEIKPTVEVFGNSKHLSPGPHVAHCGLGGFLHDIAQLAGQCKTTFALHESGFGSEYFTADFSPRKTGYESNFILGFVTVRTVLWNPNVVNNIFVGDFDAVFRAVFDNRAGNFSADG